jgi:hypothetical protein
MSAIAVISFCFLLLYDSMCNVIDHVEKTCFQETLISKVMISC